MAHSVIDIANEYLSWDINSETRDQVRALVIKNDVSSLEKIMTSRLAFGTAGLRGPMGPGYNAMNELVILQTCQGLVKYLETVQGPSFKEKGIVIGYDHRKYGSISSLSIARISAAVFLSQGIKVHLLENFVPTPFVAFGITYLKAAAGIMVTASHNPKRDNGFKLYWSSGCQIIAPHDSGIAKAILENLAPWMSYDTGSVVGNANAIDETVNVADAYYKALLRLATSVVPKSSLIVTYTAMHGVGTKWLKKAFELYGHTQPVLVEAQSEPDPEFPTVKFPNPEEKGALNLALSVALDSGSHVVIANDPDADRLALAEFLSDSTSASTSGHWHVFSGNEIGAILGHYQIMKWKLKRATGHEVLSNAAVIASAVSSRMLRAIAKKEDILYYDTLSGFKWIGNKAILLKQGSESQAPVDVLFSYEEALGYCVGDIVVDKDGISAATILVELAHTIYSRQLPNVLTFKDYLNHLYELYGKFVSYNAYYFCYDPKKTDEIFYALRHNDPSDPNKISYRTEFAGSAITSVKDVTMGYDSTTPDHKSDLPITPESHMIMFEFSNGCSLILRTSGTEPKIKYYTEMTGRSSDDLDFKIKDFVDRAVVEMLQPEKYGLTKP